jgi:hypothetical protein
VFVFVVGGERVFPVRGSLPCGVFVGHLDLNGVRPHAVRRCGLGGEPGAATAPP